MQAIRPNNLGQFKIDIETNGIVYNYDLNASLNLTNIEFGVVVYVKNCNFQDNVNLDGCNVRKSITFDNCTFEDDVLINNTRFRKEIIFKDCVFKKSLTIKDTNFEYCEFTGGKYHKLNIEGNINLGMDLLTELSFSSGDFDTLSVSCKEINSVVSFKGGNFEHVYFSDSIFNKSFNIDGKDVKFSYMNFDSCSFIERVDFKKSALCGRVNFHRILFNQMVVFHEKYQCDDLSLNSVVAKQNVSHCSNGNLSSIYLKDCEFIGSFDCLYYGASKGKSVDHSFSCAIYGFIRGNIVFENIIVSSITIGCNNFGNIVFRNIETHFITIKDFLNYSKLTFANLRLVYRSHTFIIFDSNIDKTEFVNVDFRKFDEIVIARSEVSNIILSNSILPTRIQIGTKNPILGYTIAIDENINDNVYHRENYRQLKLAMEKQGNRSTALLYKSKEMHYLRKELSWGADKLLLYLNYVSNNHGLSWARGVFFTFIISVFMYVIYELTLINPHFSISYYYNFSQTKSAFFNSLNYYAEFIASFPLYKGQSERASSWQTFLVIMLSRILIGYGVYQTIAAFRKFASK